MVRLEEVEDEEFHRVQANEQDDDDDYTDTGISPLLRSFARSPILGHSLTIYPPLDSSLSDGDDIIPTASSETLTERILALRDIVPPAARRRISAGLEMASSYVTSGLWLGGKAMWVLSTSVLLVGVPFALAVGEEQHLAEMEKEQRIRELGNEVCC